MTTANGFYTVQIEAVCLAKPTRIGGLASETGWAILGDFEFYEPTKPLKHSCPLYRLYVHSGSQPSAHLFKPPFLVTNSVNDLWFLLCFATHCMIPAHFDRALGSALDVQ